MNEIHRPHNHPCAPEAGAAPAHPILAEATRGAMVESRHRASVAVVDAGGKVVLSAGDIEAPVYARSAIKPLQALAMLESGAAEAFDLSDAEVAIACASHGAEPRHVETVAAWLARIGRGVDDLECGVHLPGNEAAMIALLKRGEDPSALHNNCSGKHTGFLTLARHLGVETRGYIQYGHPVQQRVLGVLEGMTGLDLGAAPRGIDGCGIPVIGIPLSNMALAMARLGDPTDQPEARARACARVRAAMAAEPFMVAGSGRFCTRAIVATKGRALVKTGAEGVFCGVIPEAGLGIALKVDDGAGRASEIIMARLLRNFGALGADGAATELLEQTLHNRAGTEVGHVRCPADCPF